MGKLSLLCLSLCVLVAFVHGNEQYSRRSRYGAEEYFRRQNACQLDRLQALSPDYRVQAEAGVIESWNPNNEQFQCAGVAVQRRTIEPNGLHLPSYTSAPQLIYIVRGRAIFGTVFPGCAETFEETQQGVQAGSRPREDRHQKLRHIREGDIIALPAGVAYWSYNNGDQPLVAVSLLDTSNAENQLDQTPRRFYLAGNPEEEFKPFPQDPRSPRSYSTRTMGAENTKNNIFSGFNSRFLEEAFNVDSETIRRIQGREFEMSSIVRVKGRLDVVSPMSGAGREQERERRYESESESERSQRWLDNGLEETFCSMRLKENIGDPSRSDVFNPQAGRITTVNSFNLPILSHLRLSAERGYLYKNGIYSPHWNMNAHSVIYVIRGNARVQVTDNFGQTFFDGELRQGQILTVPQQHAIVKKAQSEGFEWISFKTNDKAWVSPLAGRTSVIRALPEAVLMNSFQISREQARSLKYNRDETFLFASSRSTSPRRDVDVDVAAA